MEWPTANSRDGIGQWNDFAAAKTAVDTHGERRTDLQTDGASCNTPLTFVRAKVCIMPPPCGTALSRPAQEDAECLSAGNRLWDWQRALFLACFPSPDARQRARTWWQTKTWILPPPLRRDLVRRGARLLRRS